MNSEEIVEILSSCLEAIEQGEAVEVCLARYPEYASEIEPLLRVAATLRAGEPSQLSGAAFAHGRGIVAQAAASRQEASRQGARPVSSATQAAPGPVARPVGQTVVEAPTVDAARWAGQAMPPGSRQPGGESGARRQWAFPGAFSTALAAGVVAAAILLGLLVARGAMISLPGDTLYPLKRAGEQAQGALMAAAGDEAEWRARLAERRLGEAVALEAEGRAVSPELLGEIALEVEAVLAAAETLPNEEREEFLTSWLAELRALQPGLRGSPGGATGDALAESIAATEVSLGIAAALAPTFTPTPRPEVTLRAAGATPVPPTGTPQPVATPVETDTIGPQGAATGAAAVSPSPAAPVGSAPGAEATLPQAGVVNPTSQAAAPTIPPTPRPENPRRATDTPVSVTPLPVAPVASATVEPTTVASQIAEAGGTVPAATQAFTQGPSVASGDLPTPDGAVAAALLPSPTPFLNTSPILTGSAAVTLTDALTEPSTGIAAAMPTETSTVTGTMTPTVTPTGTLTPTATVTVTPTPTDVPSGGPVEATETPTPSDTPTLPPTATETATVEPSPTPSDTPVPLDTPTPFDTPTFTPEPTETPTVTPTELPTETPTATPTLAATETLTPTATLPPELKSPTTS